jgi:hypothetical protein
MSLTLACISEHSAYPLVVFVRAHPCSQRDVFHVEFEHPRFCELRQLLFQCSEPWFVEHRHPFQLAWRHVRAVENRNTGFENGK